MESIQLISEQKRGKTGQETSYMGCKDKIFIFGYAPRL